MPLDLEEIQGLGQNALMKAFHGIKIMISQFVATVNHPADSRDLRSLFLLPIVFIFLDMLLIVLIPAPEFAM